jgi:DNA polymerase-4
LPIEKFFGIGKVTAKKMHALGIKNGADLKARSLEELILKFGKTGKYYYNISKAIDERPVNPNRIRKSLGAERTFEEDLSDKDDILNQTNRIAEILIERIERSGTKGKTVTLKLKFNDFEVINRSKTMSHYINESKEIYAIAMELMRKELPAKKGIRLIGLSVSNLDSDTGEVPRQLTIEF